MGDAGGFASDLNDALPELTWYIPSSEEFKKSRVTYCVSNPAVPRMIVCPRDVQEVASVVRLARERQIPFTVRTGGHDIHGRSIVHDTLCIDMRAVDAVTISEDRKTATIGGGVLFGKLLTDLHMLGLVTPHGSVPSIGYVGWASLGGYGCNSASFGLGVDQILAAEVVNHQGDIVEADEDMLRGIRGAGGNFGIVTSLKIKVYEVNLILGGMLLLDTKRGFREVFKDVMLKIQELDDHGWLPKEVVLQPIILNHPQAGRSFGITFIWSSNDVERGRAILDGFIKQLPTPVWMNGVSEMSPPDWLYLLDSFIARNVWGGAQSISFGRLSPRVLDIMGDGLEAMPSDPGTVFCLHALSKQSPSITDGSLRDISCFNPEARQPHTMVEIVGSSLSEDAMERSGEWAKTMREALFACGEAMSGSYISLVSPETASPADVYGENIGLVESLKKKYDPDGIFRYAVPRLLD